MAGYAMQSSKSFNPFLAEPDISSTAQFPFQDAQVSNPFLSNFTQEEHSEQEQEARVSDNPFLNYSSEPTEVSGAGSNPFADFFQTASIPISEENMGWSNVNNDKLDECNIMGIETEIRFPVADEETYVADRPRHSVPRSTQDLLETVTGALEATSDSLLDRLRVTQPSPIPQPPSPTPSPRTPSPDLWLSDEHISAPPPSANSISQPSNQGHSIMDLFDGHTNSGPKSSFEILGLYSQTPQQASAVAPAPNAVDELFSIDEPKPENNEVESALPTLPPFASSIPENQIKPTESNEEADIIQVQAEPRFETETSFEVEVVKPPSHEESLILDVVSIQASVVQTEPPASQVDTTVPPQLEATIITNTFQGSHAAIVTTAEEAHVEIKSAKPPERPKPPPPVRAPAPPIRVPGRPPPPVPPAPRVCHPPPPRPVPPPQVPIHIPEIASVPSVPVVQIQSHVSSTFNSETKQAFVPPTSDVKVFDSFAAKFEGLSNQGSADPFGETGSKPVAQADTASAWGDSFGTTPTPSAWGNDGSSDANATGFGNDDGFDSFLAMTEPPPVPQSTPSKVRGENDYDMDKDDADISIFIRPKADDAGYHLAPALAPPPKSPAISTGSNFSEDSATFVPFLSSVRDGKSVPGDLKLEEGGQLNRSDSQDSPQTPLYEEDTTQPLEDFPRTKYTGNGWDMHMRHPNKKKITGQRFWKKVFVQIFVQNDTPIVQIFNTRNDKDPIQEIPLQPCYSVSDISAQQFDQFGKIFTIKLQYVFYKERPGVRPGQITKAERITTKLSQFAAYAIQGDYQGVKEFGSDLKKLGLPLEHAPQISQLAKLGTQNYEEMKQFSMCVEEALFRLHVHRDRAITYKTEEVQVTLVDEYYVEQDIYGVVTRQIARVRFFFLSFLSGNTEVELGVNDMRRQGKEVVGRHDIIPIATEEWIRIEDVELSNCVQLDEFERTKMVKFKPPDACYIELMRFRVRPPKHRELPLQVKTVFTTTGNRIEMRSDILVPGFTSRKLGQIPCEDVMLLIPIPECWIYMFRVEKHFRYGSVKSAHRRSGKVKGIERFLGAVETVEQSLMEVTSGQAKYEHHHKAIVWRIARLPKEGQGAYTTHSFFCHITLQPHEQIPDNLTKFCYVEFTMPHTTISHSVCRSIAVPSCDEPPEKCVRYLSRHEYIIEIEHTTGIAPGTYSLAATVKKEEPKVEEPAPAVEEYPGKALSDSDFSDD